MSTAFVRARLVVGDGSELDDAIVEIENGRITAVKRNGDRVHASVVVDLEGRTLMPGLIDLHTHIAGGDNAMAFGDEAKSFKVGDPIVKAVLDSVEAARTTLGAGITTVREIGCRDYIDVFLRQAQAAGQIEGPRILATGPGVCMTGGHGSFWQPERTADGVDEVVKRVRELVANKVDVVKVVSADGPETLGEWWTVQYSPEEVAAAFAEARRLGRRTATHAMGGAAIRNVVTAGVDTVEHGWYLSEESCELMGERGTYLIPTLGNVVDIIHKGPALSMPWAQMMADDEAGIFERMAMAVALGVKIAMGSDCGGNEARRHGSNADELVCYVRCGMTPMQAIVSATGEAARALRLEGEIGTVAEGKAADLVIVDGDPLEEVERVVSGVVGVVQAGAVVRDELGLLDELRRDGGARVAAETAVEARA